MGFLRYWTLSNVPLFLIAAPMLWLLVQSSFMALSDRLQAQALDAPPSPRNSVVRQKTLELREISDSSDIEIGRAHV